MSVRLLLRRAVLGIAVAAVFSVAVPAVASAATESLAITPCATCTPSSSTFTAGGSPSFSTTLNFDTANAPQSATIVFGAGVSSSLAANPSCLTSIQHTAACLIGTGTVAATSPVSFNAYLVPSTGGGAAGIDMVNSGITIAHAEVGVGQPLSGSPPNGPVLVALTFVVPPAPGITGITLKLNGTLNGHPFTRMPTSCALTSPSAATVTYSGGGGSELTNASPDVNVSSTCNSLPCSPAFSASAVKDAGDQGAAVTTTIAQGSGQAASKQTVLSVPSSTLAPNLNLLGLACGNTDPATCPATATVGSVTAVSPLLPVPFTGKVVVTKGIPLPGLTLVLTSPFKVELPGTLALTASGVSTTFANIADIPLSVLTVALSGGPNAPFQASCGQSSAVIGGAFTAQNGKTASQNAPITVKGCSSTTTKPGKPKLSGGSLAGLAKGHPKLRFKANHGSNAPNVSSISIGLPSGLSFNHTAISKEKVKGLSLSGGALKSAKLSGGKLVITLKKPVGNVSVTLAGPVLTESNGLQNKVKHHQVKSLIVKIKVKDAKGAATALSLKLSASDACSPSPAP